MTVGKHVHAKKQHGAHLISGYYTEVGYKVISLTSDVRGDQSRSADGVHCHLSSQCVCVEGRGMDEGMDLNKKNKNKRLSSRVRFTV